MTLNTYPDREGIETNLVSNSIVTIALNTYPDREGIETRTRGCDRRCRWLNTYPDREGIETVLLLYNLPHHLVDYLPRPRGD